MEKHKGTSVVEILQNCVIYNNGCHAPLLDKEEKENNTIILQHGEPMIFGKNNDKGLVLDGLKLKVVEIGNSGYSKEDILIHDSHEPNPGRITSYNVCYTKLLRPNGV